MLLQCCLDIGMLMPCIVILIIYYFVKFTIKSSYEKHTKLTETLEVITVDFFIAVYGLGDIILNTLCFKRYFQRTMYGNYPC